jgi:hypothetical protein
LGDLLKKIKTQPLQSLGAQSLGRAS